MEALSSYTKTFGIILKVRNSRIATFDVLFINAILLSFFFFRSIIHFTML